MAHCSARRLRHHAELFRSANATGCYHRYPARYSHLEYRIFQSTGRLSGFLRDFIRARREIDGRAGDAARIFVNHAVVVVCLREPRLGHQFWHVDAEPIFAWDGRRRRIPGRNESCLRMVSGKRTLHSYGHHERRYGSRGGHCSAVHRRSTIDRDLAVGIFSCGRRGTRLVGMVVAGLPQPRSPRRTGCSSSDFLVSAVLVS